MFLALPTTSLSLTPLYTPTPCGLAPHQLSVTLCLPLSPSQATRFSLPSSLSSISLAHSRAISVLFCLSLSFCLSVCQSVSLSLPSWALHPLFQVCCRGILNTCVGLNRPAAPSRPTLSPCRGGRPSRRKLLSRFKLNLNGKCQVGRLRPSPMRRGPRLGPSLRPFPASRVRLSSVPVLVWPGSLGAGPRRRDHPVISVV